MFRKTISITGSEAAVLFYNPAYFKRNGATPKRIQRILYGDKNVQNLDGGEHHRRKAMFMSVMSRSHIEHFSDLLSAAWEHRMNEWYRYGDTIDLLAEAQDILCRTACAWAGVPLEEKDLRRRTADMHKMIGAFGAIGPRYWAGRRARKCAETWAKTIIRDIRNDNLYPGRNTAAANIAWYRDSDEKLLPLNIAAGELLNIIRPIVAIARYVMFVALALQQYPAYRDRIRNSEQQMEIFVQEVRRLYPYAPFIGALTIQKFNWQGYEFPKGARVLLDVYGINHDPRIWHNPHDFIPERFLNWHHNAYHFIPQGGGDFTHGHRCAGEFMTIEAMKISALFLSKYMDRDRSAENLSFNLSQIPAMPDSGLTLNF